MENTKMQGATPPASLKPNLDMIPDELKRRPQWVVWAYEWREGRDGKGKWTKPPHNPITGDYAKSNAPNTWGTFKDAINAARGGGVAGIGYMFHADDPYVGIDLDHCLNPLTGTVMPEAEGIVKRLKSYTERSPGGDGLHVIVKGALRSSHKSAEVETYVAGRYFTVTGHHYPGTPTTIESCEAGLAAWEAECFPLPPQTNGQRMTVHHTMPNSLGDAALIEKARRVGNGARFSRLWDGDFSRYLSQSEADLALCNHLAFWTDGDASHMDTLFRQSGLYREKWDERHGESTYGAMTIGKALQGQKHVSQCGKSSIESAREEELTRLAQLSPGDYGAARKAASEQLGISLAFLDREWELRRKLVSHARDDGHGHAIDFEDILPAFEPIDGAKLGDRLAAIFTKYAVLPASGAVVLTLWTLFTYCLDLFQIAPRLDLSSPEKRCGKTTVLSLLRRLVFRATLASNITPAAIFRMIAAHKPTLLIDEMDTFIEANEDMRGILNSGHTRDAAVIIRCDGENHEPRAFSTWAAMVFAHIGAIPDTLEDRNIRLPMRRKLPGQRVTSLRQTGPAAVTMQEELRTVRRQIARWVEDHLAHISAAAPSTIEGLSDRATDNWMPLLSIAEVLGGPWPEDARKAAVELSGHSMTDNESVKIELLVDIREVYARQCIERLSSSALCDNLALREERPWGTWNHGKPMTPVQLARLLKPFGVSSRTVRLEGQGTLRGYVVEDFNDAFTRYLPSLSLDSTIAKCNSATIPSQSGNYPPFQGETAQSCCTSKNGTNHTPRAECVTVALPNGHLSGEVTTEVFSDVD
jgi:hypothetical protein